MATPEPQTGDLPDEAAAEQPDAEEKKKDEKPKLSLEVNIEKPGACKRHITVTVARTDIDRYFSEQFDELMPKAEVPGFRPGHAPRKLVERRFRDRVADQVKGSLLMDSMAQISDQKDFAAISEPDFDFDAVEIPNEGPMTFEFDIEVRPEFELPQWKGLKIEKPVRKYTDADVDQHMTNLLARFGQLVPHDGPADEGDFVTVNLTFRHDGKQISKFEEETVRIRPRLSFRDGTLEGFDKLVVGAESASKKTAKLRLGANAENEDLRGEDIDVEIEILDVKKLDLPKIDARLLERIGEFESEEQLRDAVKGEMNRQLAYHQNRRVREQITASLTESADWELPPELLKRQAHRELERAVMELQSAGFSNQEIQARENELRQNSAAATATALKEHFILERIAEEENIEESDEDYEQEIMLIALQQGDSPRRVRARLEKRGQMDVLRNQIIERKVLDLITRQADFTEVEFNPEVSQTEAVDSAIVRGHAEMEIPDAKPGGEPGQLRERVPR